MTKSGIKETKTENPNSVHIPDDLLAAELPCFSFNAPFVMDDKREGYSNNSLPTQC